MHMSLSMLGSRDKERTQPGIAPPWRHFYREHKKQSHLNRYTIEFLGRDVCFKGMLQRMGRGDTVDMVVAEGFSAGYLSGGVQKAHS